MDAPDRTPPDAAYRPVACGLYDRFEAAAVQRRPVRLVLRDGTALTGRIADVLSRDEAEWLVLATTDGAHHTGRLDTIAARDGEGTDPAC